MPPAATTPRRRTRRAPNLKFSQKLVLNQWVLGLFEVDTLEQLVGELKDERLEAYDENNVSLFYHSLTNRLFERGELSNEVLLGYDENIYRHTQRINARRPQAIRWKYFQYVSLLFTEIYLDRYFRDPDALLESLNAQVTKFNEDKEARDQVAHHEKKGSAKLAFWMATGSGRTLLMHINILQYRHYPGKHGRTRELNRTILLTPNEGLSKRHLWEFELSGIQAELFNKDGLSLFTGQSVEIIDMHKLGDESGDKVVAVESFDGNNLVLVDEGHRGAGAETWEAPKLEYRDLDPNDPNMVKEYRFLIEKSETEIRLRMNEIKEAVEKKLLKDFDFGKLQTFCFGQHLYQPLVYLNSDVIQVTPVELDEGERNFVLDLRKFHDREKAGFFADKELYLLRNRSKGRGIGFFEAGNFYPDFILWLVIGGKQFVSFVDPKGLRNLEGGIANPKIEFYNTIKKIEKPHLDSNIILNSFIVTPARYSDPGWWTGGLTKAEFEARHVFFQKEDPDTYIGKILARLVAPTGGRQALRGWCASCS
jgi:hypothetical protein